MVWLLTEYTLAAAAIMEITQQFFNPTLFLEVNSSFIFQHKKEQHFYVAKGKLQFVFFFKKGILSKATEFAQNICDFNFLLKKQQCLPCRVV